MKSDRLANEGENPEARGVEVLSLALRLSIGFS
jgi:hypothetical protein